MARGTKPIAAAAEPVDGPWELPDGWRWERLGDLGKWGSGGTPKANDTSFYGGDIPWVRSGELRGTDIWNTEKTLTEVGFSKSSSKWVPPGALLVALYGATIGKAAITGIRCTTNQAVAFCIPNGRMNSRYALHYVTSIKDRLCALGQGGAQPNISQAILTAYPIPLPKLSVQERIVARIDALFAEIDDGERALAAAREGVETYRKSLLKAAVTGELTADWRRANPPTETGEDLIRRILTDRRAGWEADSKNQGKRYTEPSGPETDHLPDLPEGWCRASLEQVAFVSGGVTVDQKRKPKRPLEVPYLRVANVQRGHLDLTVLKTIIIEQDDLPALRLEPGDILLNEGGDRDKVGRGWIWEGQFPNCVHQNHVFKARPVSNAIIPALTSIYMNELGRGFFLDESKQTTNLASISRTKVIRAPVAVPPFAEGVAILAAMDAATNQVADAAALDGIVSSAVSLRQSILAAAFRGELAA